MYKLLKYILIFTIVFFIQCRNFSSPKNNLDNDNPLEKTAKIIYRIPSPIEVINLFKLSELEYNEDVLNPMGNWENYTNLLSQSINLGIYSADLAYSAAFEQYQQSALYFDLIKKLSEKVGISTLLSAEMVGRVQNNLQNADSLRVISNDYYKTMIDYLSENEKFKELSLVYVGGWIENIYILTSAMDTTNLNLDLKAQLSDQRLTSENLNKLLELTKSDKDLNLVFKDIAPIFKLYQNLEVEENKPIQVADNNNEIVISGGTSWIITQKEIVDLRNLVRKIRSKWIKL